jgi:hypothetical protein
VKLPELKGNYFQYAKRGSMGADAMCSFIQASQKYFFGFCVLLFYFISKNGVGLNHKYSQLSLFKDCFKTGESNVKNTQITFNDPSLASPDKTLTS